MSEEWEKDMAREQTLRDARIAEIAAAEERGRRAWSEERDELRALVTQFVEMAHHPTDCDPLEGECSCGLSNLLDAARAALAPRDSGKEG